MRAAHRGVDAVIGLQAADDQAFEVLAGQQLAEIGLVERVPGSFAYTQVFRRSQQTVSQLPTVRTMHEWTVLFFVLNQNHRNASVAGALAQIIDRGDHAVDFKALIFTSTQRLLDVDDQ